MTSISTIRERHRAAAREVKILRKFRERAELRDEQHRLLREDVKILRERIKILEEMGREK